MKTLILLSLLTAGWDARMTDQCLDERRCVEANPILGERPSDARLYGTILGTQVLADTLAWKLHKHSPRAARWTVGVTIMIHGAAIAHNFEVGR